MIAIVAVNEKERVAAAGDRDGGAATSVPGTPEIMAESGRNRPESSTFRGLDGSLELPVRMIE